jgi:hypothetical protein
LAQVSRTASKGVRTSSGRPSEDVNKLSNNDAIDAEGNFSQGEGTLGSLPKEDERTDLEYASEQTMDALWKFLEERGMNLDTFLRNSMESAPVVVPPGSKQIELPEQFFGLDGLRYGPGVVIVDEENFVYLTKRLEKYKSNRMKQVNFVEDEE